MPGPRPGEGAQRHGPQLAPGMPAQAWAAFPLLGGHWLDPGRRLPGCLASGQGQGVGLIIMQAL